MYIYIYIYIYIYLFIWPPSGGQTLRGVARACLRPVPAFHCFLFIHGVFVPHVHTSAGVKDWCQYLRDQHPPALRPVSLQRIQARQRHRQSISCYLVDSVTIHTARSISVLLCLVKMVLVTLVSLAFMRPHTVCSL